VRDEAARLGSGGAADASCCSSWLKELSPVNLGLAKDQHLSLNPTQISGGCGRLLCCLKYEHEFYVDSRKRFPREGKAVQTARGIEKVVAVDIFRERVFLRSDEQGPRIIPLEQLLLEMESPQLPPIALPAAPPARSERRSPPVRRPAQWAPATRQEPPRTEPSPTNPTKPAEEGKRPGRRRRGRRRQKGRDEGGQPPASPQGEGE
jgi:hypothetical protein